MLGTSTFYKDNCTLKLVFGQQYTNVVFALSGCTQLVLVVVYGRSEITYPSHPQRSRECLILEAERLYRKVGKKLTNVCCITTQKSEHLIFTAAET
jgi:hypothetical protein